MKATELTNIAKTKITGKQYVDTYLKKGTTFQRIQSSKDFENFAFMQHIRKSDSDKYMGLFGKTLQVEQILQQNKQKSRQRLLEGK